MDGLRSNTLSILLFTFLLLAPLARAENEAPPDPNQSEFLTEEDALRQAFLLPEDVVVDTRAGKVYPGSTSNSPTGFGISWGDVFAGIGYQSHTRFGPKPDGAFSLGFGVGEPVKYAALETVINMVDLSGGASGTVSVKAHRWFGDYSVALGADNIFKWGGPDGGNSFYLVGSKVYRLKPNIDDPFASLILSLGVGTGAYQSDFSKFRSGESGFGVFGSVGLQIDRSFSVFAEWTGPDLNLGFSVVPFDRIPLALTVAFADLTKSAGEGVRYIAALGYGFNILGED